MGKDGYEEVSPLIDHNEQLDRSPAPPQQAEARKWCVAVTLLRTAHIFC